jgi:hypothetical protein
MSNAKEVSRVDTADNPVSRGQVGSVTSLNIGTAYQKLVRDRKAKEDLHNLFGNYWDGINKDLSKAVVREINIGTAKKLIEEYEWLGCMPAITWYCYGIYFDDVCGGCVVFSPEYIENLGRWDKYDYTGKIILLSRGVCLHWTPVGTNSKLITQAVKMLPINYKVVTATTDHLAGEIGTIYQACNFYYVGSMRDANPNVNSKNGDRDGWIIDGKLYGARSLRLKYGDTKIETLRHHHKDVKKVKQNSKHRYFLFRGTKKEQIYYKKQIEHLIKPYPKRL